ncbi:MULTISPECIES: flagellar basal-body MS-ring/collar protein FliF [unclassified Sphingomonas]|uniref:flagellar basal-body MS-ring/collar protein FliF n=1 Tax=unclassified Sphingomonas TaxID=196159 RepID=UPI0021519786|nr:MULTISPECIES: flagellar basal-body MS-ring/collar protein FliF [unclassified Sphingomonas]MCR5870516.1 flagellar M-ring protein FliF [Sphingomonas sp. J344]UUY01139.1 flagellar M-ring protein FliF [Sphingomonas sp. J315]
MSNAIATADAAPANAGMANPMKQLGGILSQPAVKRSLPLIFMLGLIAAAALAWISLSTPPQRVLFANLPESDKAAVAQALDAASIANGIDGSGSITVGEDDYHKARMLLAGQDLPKAAPGGYALLDNLPMGASRAVEGERLRQARETELARSIGAIDTVAEARVHLATPEASVFVRDKAEPSASVIVKLQPGRALSDAQVRSIVNLVASSVPGMKPDSVTIVDQMGALLSKSGQESSAGDARIDFQNRVEDKVRQQLVQLLTPLLGAGNFSAEVQAEVDLDESQATRESYDKEGTVVRAEQGNWTGAPRDAAAAPGGIPGALSNVPPPPSTVATPTPDAPAQPGQLATPVAAPGMKQSDSFTRSYSNGREVSVTRNMPGSIKRLSVAVLLREEPGKPRGQVEIRQIDELVKATVGYKADRQDQVTVVSRKFSTNAAAEAEGIPFYETTWFAMIARNVTALVIALLVLLLGVRPLARSLMRRRDDARGSGVPMGAADGVQLPTPVSPQMLSGSGLSLGDRVGLVRDFTRDNPARAALAVRDMIRTEGQ